MTTSEFQIGDRVHISALSGAWPNHTATVTGHYQDRVEVELFTSDITRHGRAVSRKVRCDIDPQYLTVTSPAQRENSSVTGLLP